MAKKIIDLVDTGYLIGDLTWDWCKSQSDGSSVSTVNSILTERGNGVYLLDNPDVLEDSDFRIHVTANSDRYYFGTFTFPISPEVLSDIITPIIGPILEESLGTAIAEAMSGITNQVINLTATTPIIVNENNLTILVRSVLMPNMVGTVKSSGDVDFRCKQGTTWKLELRFKLPDNSPYPLTDCSFAAQIRKHYKDLEPIAIFTPTISIPEEDGIVFLLIDADDTEDIPIGRYVYDVELTTPDNEVMRVVEGKITIDPETTKALV